MNTTVNKYRFYQLTDEFMSGRYACKSIKWVIENDPNYIIYRLKNPIVKVTKSKVCEYDTYDLLEIENGIPNIVDVTNFEYTHFVLSQTAYKFLLDSVNFLIKIKNLSAGNKLIFLILGDIQSKKPEDLNLLNSKAFKYIQQKEPSSIHMAHCYVRCVGIIDHMIKDMIWLNNNKINEINSNNYHKEQNIIRKRNEEQLREEADVQKAIKQERINRQSIVLKSNDQIERDYFDAMTDGQMGDYDNFIANGGDIDFLD